MATVAGCGFQLKGASQEGNDQWEGVTLRLISADPRSELTREVTRELVGMKITLSDDISTTTRLTLREEQFEQRNVSLTAQARAAEMELTLSVDFVLQQEETLPLEGTARVSQQMLNDPRNVVGKTEEMRLLREEMRRDLARQIVRRVSRGLAR
ncbi:MAG: LPS assembly lipoprotein LptE [Halieaceae bacterium]